MKNLKNENNKSVQWNFQRLTSLFILIWYSWKRGLSSMVCDELTTEIRRLTSLFILIWYSGKRGLSSMVCDELTTEIRRLTSLFILIWYSREARIKQYGLWWINNRNFCFRLMHWVQIQFQLFNETNVPWDFELSNTTRAV